MKKMSFLIIIWLMPHLSYSQEFEELAKTPPLGWNSWNCFRCTGINEKVIMEIADAMVSSGMKNAGYEYIVIDDCWQIDRDEKGNIMVDKEKFPSGMKFLADYIHSKGLKFGIYSCAGSKTCQGRPGSRGYQFQDARQYASWGVDYLKYDWCHNEGQEPKAAYKTMRDALVATGRPIVFSICEWGKSKPWKWGKGIGHLWRTTGDIRDCWDCDFGRTSGGVLKILDLQTGLHNFAGPGHWNDPDMLEVGNDILTESESRAHFSLWCMLAAPLMAGNDLINMDESTRNILTNIEAIAIDQDSLGKQGRIIVKYGDIHVWLKKLVDGLAVCFFNRGNQTNKLNITWDALEIESDYKIRDVWLKQNIGTTSKHPQIKYNIPSHDLVLLRLTEL